ncbi:hypothetical protein ACUN7V_08020 [Quadrisphaera oryzae]|uniref:hypothetical protein n=1 Tax=Quadrisphaera TaxID=317661 RepID=UPI0016458C42|nr:hypothetical protein [Quadrisphaera sp. RL12-1S]MBC3761668.1 hypothetical protein [Quadrisphaera sp. RL12-1S]
MSGCTAAAPDGSATQSSSTPVATTGTSVPPETTPVPTPSTPAGPPASTAPAVGVTTVPPVGLSSPAPFGDGLVATVTAVERVQLKGTGPGEVAGPGTAVSLTLRNGTTARVDLGGVVVGVTYGDGSPGDPSTSVPADVPGGVLEPGASVKGVWVFSRPSGATDPVEVTVGSVSSAAVVTIRS